MGIWALDFIDGVDSGQGGEWIINVTSLSVAVTNATQAVNCQITTSAPHGLGVGDHIVFNGIVGMVQLNSTQPTYETGVHKRVAQVIDSTNFTLDINSTGFGAYISGGNMHHPGVGRSNPTHVRLPNHPFVEGELVHVLGCGGTTQVNNIIYICKNITPNAIQLALLETGELVNGAGFGVYTSGGTTRVYNRPVQSITKANPAVFTVKAHGFTNGQAVFVDGGDMPEISGQAIVVANVTANTFEASGIDSTFFTDYTDGSFVRRPAKTNLYIQNTVPAIISPEGQEIRIKATPDPIQRVSSDLTWTNGNNLINTSVSLVGTVAVGDLIGRQAEGGNGNIERFYKVLTINATTIALDTRYYGVSGTDVASVYHLPLSSIPGIGNNVQHAINNLRNCFIKGGYNPSFTLQTGQSWFKHAFSKLASSSNSGILITEGSIDKVNFVDGYYCLQVAGTSNPIITNSTFLCAYVATALITGQGTLENCIIAATFSNSFPTLSLTNTKALTFSNVYVWGATDTLTTSPGVVVSQVDGDLNAVGLTVVCAGIGLTISSANTKVKGITLERCYTNIRLGTAASNFLLDSCSILNPIAGGANVIIGNLNLGGTLKNINFNGQSTLVVVSQSTGSVFQNCTFTNYNIGVTFDQYCGSCILEDCHFTSPGNFAVNIASSNVKDITYRSCTVDPGEEAKAFNIINHDTYTVPYYILEDSFGVSGKIYGRLQLTADYSTYYSAPPSLKVLVNTNINSNYTPVEVLSEWVRSGIGRNFKFKMKRDTVVFNGTITPIFYLNGKQVETLSPINTLSETWEDYELECPAIKIDKEGHLELRLLINGNASTFWIDDFTAEDL